LFTQSPLTLQVCPSWHRSGQAPPQSMSPSSPFLVVSAQVGAAQVPPVHTLLAQSLPVEQARPSAQPAQGPPQSVSLSPPFFTPSVQMGSPWPPSPPSPPSPAEPPSPPWPPSPAPPSPAAPDAPP
jgi:hypothetical protein